ncbi:MAG: TolC family protein [bacterium]
MHNHTVKAVMTWALPSVALLGMAFSGCATLPRPPKAPKAGAAASPALSPAPPPALPRPTAAAAAAQPASAAVAPVQPASATPAQPAAPDNPVAPPQPSAPDNPSFQPAAAPLTLTECIKKALEQSPANRTVQQGLIAAGERVGEATAPYYPEIDLNAGYGRWQKYAFLPSGISRPGMPKIIGPTDDWLTGLRARLLLFDSGERKARRTAAMTRHWAAKEDAQRVRQDIVLSVHHAYYGLKSAQEARSIAGKSLARAEDHLRLATERKDAGTVPKMDVIRAKAEVAQARLALVRAESLIRVAKGKLNVAMGSPVETWIEIADQPEEAAGGLSEIDIPAGTPSEIDIDNALEQAVKTRPALKAALLRTAAAQSEIDAAKSTFGPKILAEGGYGWRGPDFFPDDEEWSVGASVGWQIFSGFSGRHRLSRTKAELSKEEAEVSRLVLEVQQEVWSSYSKLKETYEAIQTAVALVQDAQEGLRLARERYEAGSGPISDLLDTQTALDRAEAARLEAQWDYLLARASFLHSIGNLD